MSVIFMSPPFFWLSLVPLELRRKIFQNIKTVAPNRGRNAIPQPTHIEMVDQKIGYKECHKSSLVGQFHNLFQAPNMYAKPASIAEITSGNYLHQPDDARHVLKLSRQHVPSGLTKEQRNDSKKCGLRWVWKGRGRFPKMEKEADGSIKLHPLCLHIKHVNYSP